MTHIHTKLADIEDIFSRGVASFIDPDGIFRNKVVQKVKGEYKKDIIIKFGVDPTRPDIHLGHAVLLRTLRRLQDIGCKVVFLVGDFTAQIGDPTGKNKVRPEIGFVEIEQNMHTYLAQVGKILRTEPEVFSWIRNSDWLLSMSDILPDSKKQIRADFVVEGKNTSFDIPTGTLLWKAAAFEQSRMQVSVLHNKEIHDVTLRGFLSVLRHITHSRLIQRDFFQERIKNGEELFLHEMMYPVLQGIDSHVIARVYGSCDIELGGNDQTFNMLLGRDIMKMVGQEPQAVLSMALLPGTDGKEKMSKSLGNYIGITDASGDMFGKIMSIPDTLLPLYFELATYVPNDDVRRIKEGLSKKTIHPKDIKMDLAFQIVTIYHGQEAAKGAKEEFESVFKKGGEIPKHTPTISVSIGAPIVDVLVLHKIVTSKSEWRRLVEAGAVSICSTENPTKIFSDKEMVKENITLRIGKHRFVRLVVTNTAT